MHVSFAWAGAARMLGCMMHMYEPQKRVSYSFLHVANM